MPDHGTQQGRTANSNINYIIAIAVLLLAGFASSCTKPKDVAVSCLGETWDIGEIKVCTEGQFKGESESFLLCNPQGGAAFYMAAGAMGHTRDQQLRAQLRDLFVKTTKTFQVGFDKRPEDGARIWHCLKTETGLKCRWP